MTATVRLLPSSDRTAIAAVWTGLEAAGARAGVSASWDWTETWLDHLGPVVPHRFAIAERGAEPIAAALVCGPVRRVRSRVPMRTLLIGTAGEPGGERVHVEHNRLLALPGEERAASAALLQALRDEGGWDELSLPGFAPDDAEPWGRDVRWTSEPSPLCALASAGRDGVLGLLGAGVRRRVRRSLREYGTLETEWARTPEHALDVLDELVALHTRRWAARGEPGAFAGRRVTAFHRALVARWTPEDRAMLFRVRAADRTIGCLYGHVDDGRLHFYQGGMRREIDNRLRPGFVAHVLCMDECRERGLREYDFLAGDSRYKRELSTGAGELWWGSLTRPGARSIARAGAARVAALGGRR